MQEVIYRRFRRAQEGAPGFERRPDLLFIDGGRGHVNAVKEVLTAMGEHIVTVGMVKDERHRTRGLIIDGEEIDLKKHPVLYRYVTSIQDEVHRFAIDYHRGLRKKAMEKSILDEIPGIGQNRKRALLAAFGSIENIRNADADELAAIDGMNRKAAEAVSYTHLDEDDCMVDIAKFFLEFTVDESCGKCPPCRIGTKRMLEILEKITEGREMCIRDSRYTEACGRQGKICFEEGHLLTDHFFRDL